MDWDYETVYLREHKYLGRVNTGEEVTETSEDEYVESDKLKAMGKEGWELVSTRTKPCEQSDQHNWVIHYFKRPLSMSEGQ